MMMGGDGSSGGGNTNQFIGSKISLISKSEIRYEGILYSLDLEEATISLQKVRSFGTEDRPTPRPVPPKDEVYEFIIFRGADIKGIDVLEPPPPPGKEEQQQPNEEPIDPAIVEVQHYQPQQPQQQQPPIGSSLGAVGGEHNNIHRNSFGNSYVGLVGGPMLGGGNSLPQAPQPHHPQQFSLGVGFGSSNAGPIGPPTGNASSGAIGQPVPPPQSSASSSTTQQQQQRPPKPPSPSSPDRNRAQQQRNQQPRAYAPRGRGGQHASPQQQQPQQQSRPYNPNLPQRGGQPQRNGGYNNYGGYNRYPQNAQGNRGGYFRRGELRGNKKLTFDGEFDFEKANEELQKALEKIKVSGDEEEEEHHAEEEHESEDNGSDAGNKENDSKSYYSKDNFFDSISCEALERKSGKREKPDWRAERKLNAETFGLPMNRGGRGGQTYYRGGGYNNYGRGGYGGYRGGGQGYGRGQGYQQRGGRGGGFRRGPPRGDAPVQAKVNSD